ncbi:MAG: LPXTG cell wall anchor domain-containing protein, partial [Caldilinea sp.]
ILPPAAEATPAPAEEAPAAVVATPASAEEAPDRLPVTGSEPNNGLGIALVAGLILFVVAGFAVASRRRLA